MKAHGFGLMKQENNYFSSMNKQVLHWFGTFWGLKAPLELTDFTYVSDFDILILMLLLL